MLFIEPISAKFITDKQNDYIPVYYGSKLIVDKPIILKSGFNKDFGNGFYVTKSLNHAKRCSIRGNISKCIVSKYDLSRDYCNDTNYKLFTCVSDEWIEFIANCRYGYGHNYSIIEGPMVDDTIWNFVDDYLDGRLEYEVLNLLFKLKNPERQIVFANNEAIDKYLKFNNFYEVY